LILAGEPAKGCLRKKAGKYFIQYILVFDLIAAADDHGESGVTRSIVFFGLRQRLGHVAPSWQRHFRARHATRSMALIGVLAQNRKAVRKKN
jgi:hypothetical protein